MLGSALALTLTLGAALPRPRAAAPDPAQAIVDTAIARMGGAVALRGIKTARYELITQWLTTSFSTRPFSDAPGYEVHSDLRDYDAKIWRNVRRFRRDGSWLENVDLVVDTVAARHTTQPQGVASRSGVVDGWSPLNVAYIDERRELFALTPERLVIQLRDARDLRSGRDTSIGGLPHSSVSATIDGYPFVVYFRKSTGLPTVARYRADEANDFGLAPWGPGPIEVWYSSWRGLRAGGVIIPMQWDIVRAGLPYKRMSVIAAEYNVPVAPDSVTLPSSVRAAYLANERHPMGDIPLDSAKIIGGGRVASFGSPAGPRAAVKIAGAWWLIEPGNLPLNAQRAAEWLATHDDGAHVGGGILTGANPAGGSAWLATQHLPLYVAPAAAVATDVSLGNYGAPRATVHRVQSTTSFGAAAGSPQAAVLEPMDFMNTQGALVIYVPSMRWLYTPTPLGVNERVYLARRIKERGWAVDRIATPANLEGVAP